MTTGRAFPRAFAFAFLSSLLLAACLPQAARVTLGPDEKLQITRQVWNNFLEYKAIVGWRDGAFVVSETGDGSGYAYCPSHCRPYNYTRRAIDLCEDAGVKCVLFANDWEIVVDYEIVE